MKRALYRIGVLFLLYVVWSLACEAVFTGVADIIRNAWDGKPFDSSLPCRTSLWSILVYGVPATIGFSFIGRFWPAFFKLNWKVRGLVYAVLTFASEYAWADFLVWLTGSCPCQYRDSPITLLRYIKPEYFGLWFLFGFTLEGIKVKILPRVFKD